MADARVLCQSVLVEYPDGRRELYVDLRVDCPLCGTYGTRVAGHHLRAIRNFLIQTIDQYPDLSGPEPTEATIERLRVYGPGNDPVTG